MNLADLNKVATAMVAPGRGILAADESSGTIKKRFDAIGVDSTEDSEQGLICDGVVVIPKGATLPDGWSI